MTYSKEEQLKARYEKKLAKAKQKTLPQLKASAQRVFNKWIRERDKRDGCISCGTRNAEMEAGHYIAQGSCGFLRYEPLNVHKQCKSCNHFKSANLVEYRIALVKKIGEKNVKFLEENRHKTKKWTREELNQIITDYKIKG